MINFWKLAYETVKEKRDQHKTENEQLKEENEKLKTQKIAFQRSYKQAYEENEKLEQIREIKDSALKGADIKIKTLEQENNNLKQSVSDYKDYAEGHVASYLEMRALEHENEQLKEELLQSDYVKASVFSDREEYKKQIVKLQEELETTEQENVGLKLMNESFDKQLEIFHRCFNSLLTKLDINKDKDNLLSEISQHIGNKPSSSTYKYFRAKLDDLNITEDE